MMRFAAALSNCSKLDIPAVSQPIFRPVWAKSADPSHPPATAETTLDNDFLFLVTFNCLQAEKQICMLLNLNISRENVEIS